MPSAHEDGRAQAFLFGVHFENINFKIVSSTPDSTPLFKCTWSAVASIVDDISKALNTHFSFTRCAPFTEAWFNVTGNAANAELRLQFIKLSPRLLEHQTLRIYDWLASHVGILKECSRVLCQSFFNGNSHSRGLRYGRELLTLVYKYEYIVLNTIQWVNGTLWHGKKIMINWAQKKKTLFIWFKTRQRKLCAVCDWANKEWTSQSIVGAWRMTHITRNSINVNAASQFATVNFGLSAKMQRKFPRIKIKNSKWYCRGARRRKDVVEHPAFMHFA